jgi:hypothetical protein
MYFLWVGEEPLPKFVQHSCVRVARTTVQAKKIIGELGFPMIVSFGRGSIPLAHFIHENRTSLPENFTFRVHHHRNMDKIKEIMKYV